MVFGFPVFCPAQRRFSLFGGEKFVYSRQQQREAALVEHIGEVVFVVDRERFAPVTLAAENGITQPVVDFYAAYAFFP